MLHSANVDATNDNDCLVPMISGIKLYHNEIQNYFSHSLSIYLIFMSTRRCNTQYAKNPQYNQPDPINELMKLAENICGLILYSKLYYYIQLKFIS